MHITIESKAKPCPGVLRALAMAEDTLRRGEKLVAVGELIHNSREIKRLKDLGLQMISEEAFLDNKTEIDVTTTRFLVRAHGEAESLIHSAKERGMKIDDATCPIVHHSHDLILTHVHEGWGIILVGKKDHAEVRGLIPVMENRGTVISSIEEAQAFQGKDKSLLLAQTTISPKLFHDIGKILSHKMPDLKIVDTTCRFIRTRQTDIQAFAEEQDVVLVLGGKKSSNCKLLYETAKEVNAQTYRIESAGDVDWIWFNNGVKVGITGGASTPKWQLEELRSILENHTVTENNPEGLKYRKGGTFLCRMFKKTQRKK